MHLLTPFPNYRKIFYYLLIFSVSLLGACQRTDFVSTETPPPTTESTSAPTLTPTPTPAVSKSILLNSETVPDDIAEPIFTTLTDLSASVGWESHSADGFEEYKNDPGVRVVVALPPDPGVVEMAQNSPEIQFIGIGIPGLQPTSNLSLIGSDGFPLDQQSFLAGYIAAVNTEDWRIGGIIQGNTETGQFISDGFENGIVFYCGLCRLTYPPFYNYPIISQIPENASDAEWLNAVDFLVSNSVDTVFIFSRELPPSVVDVLAQNGLSIIGIQAPLPDQENFWLTTIRFSPEIILAENWDDIISGQAGWEKEIPLLFEHSNENLFSIGRQLWVSNILDEMLEGYIDTGISLPASDTP